MHFIFLSMKIQNYSNHLRYYPPHHFIFYPLLGLLFGLSVYKSINTGNGELWLMLSVLILCLGWLSFMLRQHYSLGNQNRIVRLEVRLRYFELTGQRFEPIEQRLSFGQIAAVRFASDEEFTDLVRRAIAEDLTAAQIKKAIKNWKADEMRV